MHPAQISYVKLENEDISVRIWPHLPLCQVKGHGMPEAYFHSVIATRLIGHLNTKIKLIGPYRMNIQLLTTKYRLSLDEIGPVIDKMLTAEVSKLCNIVDHNSYISSPQWYMFIALLHRPAYRKYYSSVYHFKSIYNMLSQPVFEYGGNPISIIEMYYIFSDRRMIYSSSKKNGNLNPYLEKHRNTPNHAYLSPLAGMEDVADEYASRWGIPTKNSTFGDIY